MKRLVVLSSMATLLLTGCASTTDPSSDPSQEIDVTFSTVTSSIARGFYSVGSTATGVTDIDGTHITLSMTVLNRNNIDVFPTATITLPSGDTITCVETDPRHQTALVATTNSIDLPCDGPMPASGKGATVAFVDDGS